jgi:hypothetical protein
MSEIAINSRDLAELAAGILAAGHNLRFFAPGSSMVPFIRGGNVIEVRPWKNQPPRPMDILLYTSPDGRVVAHRVARVTQDISGVELTLRGDLPPFCEEQVDPGQVLGQVVAVEHAGRRTRLDSPAMRRLAWLWAASAPLSYFGLQFLVQCRNTVRRGFTFFFH